VIAAGQNDLRPECDQLRRVCASTLEIAGAPTLVDLHVAAIDPAQLPQAFQERPQTSLSFRAVRYAHEHADATHLLARLRANRSRPRSRTTEQRDKLAPP
jgi:hypothetical protein